MDAAAMAAITTQTEPFITTLNDTSFNTAADLIFTKLSDADEQIGLRLVKDPK
jgi:hypothetical protein